MGTPPGYITLREAVVRIAERDAPEAGVRAYLAQPDPAWQDDNLLGSALSGFTFDPYEHPVGGRADDSTWCALEAARVALVQALGSGDPVVMVWLVDGSMRECAPQAWRVPDAADLLRREVGVAREQQWSFWVQEAVFTRWLKGDKEAPKPRAGLIGAARKVLTAWRARTNPAAPAPTTAPDPLAPADPVQLLPPAPAPAKNKKLPKLPTATNEDIKAAMRVVYNRAGTPAPNIIQTWQLTRAELQRRGFYARREDVEAVADEPEFETVRPGPGPRKRAE